MSVRNQGAKRYLRDVRKAMPIYVVSSRKVVKQISLLVDEYVQEHPDAEYAEIVSRFGEPSGIVETYFDTLNPSEIAGQMNIKRKIIAIAAATALAALVILSASMISMLLDFYSLEDGYIVEKIEVIEDIRFDSELDGE